MKFLTVLTILGIMTTCFAKENNDNNYLSSAASTAALMSSGFAIGRFIGQKRDEYQDNHSIKSYILAPTQNNSGQVLTNGQVKSLQEEVTNYKKVTITYSTDPEGVRLRHIQRLESKIEISSAADRIKLQTEITKIKNMNIDNFLSSYYPNGSSTIQGVVFNLEKDKKAAKRLSDFLENSSGKHQRIYSIEISGRMKKYLPSQDKVLTRTLGVALVASIPGAINTGSKVYEAYFDDDRTTTTSKDFVSHTKTESKSNNVQKFN